MALLLIADSLIPAHERNVFLIVDTPVKSQIETTEKVMKTLDYAGTLQLLFLDCISALQGYLPHRQKFEASFVYAWLTRYVTLQGAAMQTAQFRPQIPSLHQPEMKAASSRNPSGGVATSAGGKPTRSSRKPLRRVSSSLIFLRVQERWLLFAPTGLCLQQKHLVSELQHDCWSFFWIANMA